MYQRALVLENTHFGLAVLPWEAIKSLLFIDKVANMHLNVCMHDQTVHPYFYQVKLSLVNVLFPQH